MTKNTCTCSGCSHHSVPSLSKVAMRSASGTKSAAPSFVTPATKSRIADLAAPSFQEGRGPKVIPRPRKVKLAVQMTIHFWRLRYSGATLLAGRIESGGRDGLLGNARRGWRRTERSVVHELQG